MKRIVTIMFWLISLNIAFTQTATLKIGDVVDPVSDTILVPVICEEIEPIVGNNEVNLKWFIRYYSSWLNAGEPGGSATLLNVNPTLMEGCITSEILDSTPWGSFQTIAFTCTCPTCGEIFPGEKFFDIQFTLNGGLNNLNIYWSSLGTEDTEMYDDEGNEYYLTLKGGYVGTQPPTATLKIGTLYDPIPGTMLVPITCEAINNPLIGSNLVSSGWAFYIAYDTEVLNAGEPGTQVTLLNLHPDLSYANFLTNIIADNPAPGWNTMAIIYSCACSMELNPGDKLFDIQFAYSEGTSDFPNIKWTSLNYFQTNMPDDEGNEFLLTLEDGYVGPASNDVTFHVTGNGNDLAGAWVTLGLVPLQTNAEGIAVFNLPDGDYDYTVTKEGFADEEGTFTVAGAPQLIEVEMEVCWDVSICVIGCDSATININGMILITNENGCADICLVNGGYYISIGCEGFWGYTGMLIVNSSPVTLNIILMPISYSVTFFVNCCGEPLESIPITYEGQTVLTNLAGLAILNMPAGFYSFEIEAIPITFTVPDTVYVPVDICSEVTFHITSGGEDISGTSVSIENETKLTDESGEAIFNLSNGSYPYTVEKDGYITETGQIIVSNEPVIVEMHLRCEVTFYVTCGDWPLENALITCGGSSINTDLNGNAIFNLEDGTYQWTLSHPDGFFADGFVTVNGSPVLKTIIFVCDGFSDLNVNTFILYPNPSSGKFSIENLNQTGELTEIFVTDITGRIVYKGTSSAMDKTEIDLTGQPKGMYFIRVKGEEMLMNRKVVIQ